MRRLFIICLLTYMIAPAVAQRIWSGEAQSQGQAIYTQGGIMALFANQAGLHSIEKLTVSGAIQHRYFAEGVNEIVLGAAGPLSANTGGGIYLKRFGDDLYNEASIGLGVGRQLSDRIALGVAIEGWRLGIQGYGSEFSMNAQIGLQGFVSEDVIVSSHAFIATLSSDEQTYTNQSEINVDVAVHAGDKVWVKGGIRQRIDDELGVKFGMDYAVMEHLRVHAGLVTDPFQLGAGVGLDINDRFTGHVSGFWQPDLGWTSGITLTYRL